MDTSKRYTYYFPTPIRFGVGVIDELVPHLKECGFSKILIVADSCVAALPFFEKIINHFNENNLINAVFSDMSKNPVKSDVLKGVTAFHNINAEAIIGIGGGVSMDVARAIALKANHPDNDLFDFDDATGGDKLVVNKIPYFVTVPTTCGTGSEVGRSTVISEDDTHRKRILYAPQLMARIVFADPELTLNLPSFITATTGMDALTHNIEAYVVNSFHPMCDGIALEAIKLVHEALEIATLQPEIVSRSKMMLAALMGATSFQKGLGVVHSTAHPLSTLFDVHHGLANAIMLKHGVQYNLETCRDKFAFLSRVLNLGNTAEDFYNWCSELNEKLGIPKTLSAIDVKESKLDALSQLALADVCHLSNPRPVSLEDFKQLYTGAF